MVRIAAICAPQPLPNPGMAAVEMALFCIVKRALPTASLKVFHLFSLEERNPEMLPGRRARFAQQARLPIPSESLRGRVAELYASDLIVYWGDFLHARDYAAQVSGLLLKLRLATTYEAAADLVFEHLFLARADVDVLRKTVLFGGTLLFNTERDYQDPEYSGHLRRLLTHAGGVWMRDVYSALRVQREVGKLPSLTLGVDCALLLQKDDLLHFPHSTAVEQDTHPAPAAIFVGRSSRARTLGQFAKDLCESLGLSAEWLPWFDESLLGTRVQEVQEAFPSLRVIRSESLPSLGDLLEQLAGYRFVVSDTYHVCLNAWNLGVPAVCVGGAFPEDYYDAAAGWYGVWRDKRQVFYAMHDAMEFYATEEELLDEQRRARRVCLVADGLQDEALLGAIRQGIRDQATRTEADFLRVVRGLLDNAR